MKKHEYVDLHLLTTLSNEQLIARSFFELLLDLRQDPLDVILVIFGHRALIFFRLKALGKNGK